MLGTLFVVLSFFIWFGLKGDVFSLGCWKLRPFSEEGASSFSLGLKQDPLSFSYPAVEGEVDVLIGRKHPASLDQNLDYYVRLKKNGVVKRVSLPARIGLYYENGLKFSENEDAFWLELEISPSGPILARSFVMNLQGEKHLIESFSLVGEELAFSKGPGCDLPAFRSLMGARYLGKDLVLMRLQEGDALYLLTMHQETLRVKEGDLLLWIDGKWCKSEAKDLQGHIVARVAHCLAKDMILEAWDLDGKYHRFLMSMAEESAVQPKSGNFLTALRVRSEKQVSCMLEKQCLIVQLGDWILKTSDNRWKILRNSEDKNAYLQDRLRGELLIFDRMDVKNGHKVLITSLFSPQHSQMTSMEWEISQGNKRKAEQGRK